MQVLSSDLVATLKQEANPADQINQVLLHVTSEIVSKFKQDKTLLHLCPFPTWFGLCQLSYSASSDMDAGIEATQCRLHYSKVLLILCCKYTPPH